MTILDKTGIVKAGLLLSWIDDKYKKLELKHDDLILIHICKIEGSPTEWLQEKYLKRGD